MAARGAEDRRDPRCRGLSDETGGAGRDRFERTPYSGNLSLILFEAGFLVAGTVLPLVLVHLFGRLLPGWMLILPGFAIGGGMMAYFGVGLIQMIVATIQGEPSLGDDGVRRAGCGPLVGRDASVPPA